MMLDDAIQAYRELTPGRVLTFLKTVDATTFTTLDPVAAYLEAHYPGVKVFPGLNQVKFEQSYDPVRDMQQRLNPLKQPAFSGIFRTVEHPIRAWHDQLLTDIQWLAAIEPARAEWVGKASWYRVSADTARELLSKINEPYGLGHLLIALRSSLSNIRRSFGL